MRVGVIDVGTNSVRVLVADVDDGRLREIDRDLIITRLGEGVDRDGRLGAAPLRRTVEAIAAYAGRCDDAGCALVRITATSAVRDAANRRSFLDAVRDATGRDAEVLSGEQEAHLGFRGATIDLDAPAPYVVVDIGGGSTELVRGAREAERWISLDIGSVRLTERHIHDDPPLPEQLDAVRADANAHLDDALGAIGSEPPATLIGLAGTITTVAAVTLGLTSYDRDAVHGARLSRAQIGDSRALLASMTSEERRALPVMPRGREDVIVTGVVILEQVMDRLGVGEVRVSETDILDGTALDTVVSRTGESR